MEEGRSRHQEEQILILALPFRAGAAHLAVSVVVREEELLQDCPVLVEVGLVYQLKGRLSLHVNAPDWWFGVAGAKSHIACGLVTMLWGLESAAL